MPPFKLYVHYESAPEHTKLVKVTDPSNSTVENLLELFVSSYNAKHPQSQLLPSRLKVVNAKGKGITNIATISGVFSHQEDVFVVYDSKLHSVAPEPCPVAVDTRNRSENGETRSRKANDAARSATQADVVTKSVKLGPDPDPPYSRFAVVTNPLMAKAEQARNEKNYQQAVALLNQVQSVVPGHQQALTALAQVWLEAGKPAMALKWAKQAVEADLGKYELLELHGDCLSATDDHLQAVGEYEKALEVARQAGVSSEVQVQLQVKLAASMYTLGPPYVDIAPSIIMSVLKHNENHYEALFHYAVIARDRGMLEDALRVFMRLLVIRPADQTVRYQLAQCLQDKTGMQQLWHVFGEMQEKNSEAAYAFLSTCVKDHGAIMAATQLLRKAVELSPASSSYVLNLLHTLELEQDFHPVITLARDFLTTCSMHITEQLRLMGLQEVAAELSRLPQLGPFPSAVWLQSESWEPPNSQAHPSADHQQEEPVESRRACEKVDYTSQELDTLAVMFAVAKVLYVGGALTAAARLVRIVEGNRTASKQELHLTIIRNEAAYFGCVKQLLQSHPPPPQPQAGDTEPPLYLLGDSHCLSGAWHYLNLRGHQRLLHPILVTGCKIWHIRPESVFYPKAQFLNSIKALPPGADVIFMLGEIDCREGLLLAVQKCKYSSLIQGINATITIYINLLLQLIHDKDFTIYVHPIAPVLNETRHIVKPFVGCLKMRVNEAAQTPAAKGKLFYLDFFSKLLTPDGSKLNPELEFDGTHMAPAYVKHMQAAVDRLELDNSN